jgi:uncharacterized protein with HEPN domain
MKSRLSYVYHILDEINFIEAQTSLKGLEKDIFLEDDMAKRAFARSVEIIGEAVKNLPAEMYQKYPYIPWRKIAGMRDRLIHGYFSVDYELVWDVITNHLPSLKIQLKRIIEDESGKQQH